MMKEESTTTEITSQHNSFNSKKNKVYSNSKEKIDIDIKNDDKIIIKSKNNKTRPETPSIDVIAIRNQGDSGNSSVIKNFSSLFKQIVTNENKNFLEGDINMIEYLISKYSCISISNVSQIIKLHLKINAEYNMLNQFGEKLPNLKELKLNNSNIPSISDLGSNFSNLQLLNMDNCNLSDLTGLVCFNNLKEFSAKDNKINDLFEIDGLSNLQYLQLQSNKIEDLENITFISNLEKLKILILKDNPITENKEYYNSIKEYIPWLEQLDVEYNQILSFENPSFNSTGSSFYNNSNGSNKNTKSNLKKIGILSGSNLPCYDNDKEKEININKSEIFSKLDKSLAESMTTNSHTNNNSFLNSHSTFKSIKNKNTSNDNSLFQSKNSNVLNINIDNTKLIKLNKLNPVKLKSSEDKEQNEKNQMKKVFANHNDYLDLDQEKEEIIKKLSKPSKIIDSTKQLKSPIKQSISK